MKTFAEALRWFGFLLMLAGATTLICYVVILLAPLVVVMARLMIDVVGLAAFSAFLIPVGFAVWHIGQWISPFISTKASASGLSDDR